MQLELTDEQAALLRELLDSALRELRVEVRRTETSTYHDELAAKEKRLREIIGQLGTGD